MHWETVIKRRSIGNVYIPSKRDKGDGPYNAYRMTHSSERGSLGLPEPLDTQIMSMFDKLGMGHPIKVHELPRGRMWYPKSPFGMKGQFYIAIIDKDGKALGDSWQIITPEKRGRAGYQLEEDEIGLSAWFDQ